LHSAVRAHRPAPGCIHHSTCGSQYFTRSYCELLRQYGLIPSSGDLTAATRYSAVTPSREIVEVPGYVTWKDVIDHPRAFIEALYSSARVDTVLGARPSGTTLGVGVNSLSGSAVPTSVASLGATPTSTMPGNAPSVSATIAN